MNRQIFSHLPDSAFCTSAPQPLKIEVTDSPGVGGANHRYEITGFDTATNPSATNGMGYASEYSRTVILFQNGALREGESASFNGITHEALLAIVIDRLESFQEGPFKCDENAVALDYAQAALDALHRRTAEREARNVEGRHSC